MYTKRWKLGTLERVKIQSDLIGNYKLTQMFDIDKLFLSTLHYDKKDTKDGSGNVLSRSISTAFKEGTEKFYANRLILDYISLLKDSKSEDDANTRSMQVGDASIDIDTKLLTDIVDDLEGSQEEDLDPYDTYSLWRNTSIRDQFVTGKFGIGPFALNNNNHILTMLYGVRFAHNPASILGVTGHESLYDAEDMYGESIMSWLSGLINAHVDVAKDPYISKLNVNKYTYNLVNLMIRTGFGKMTFYFMTQPIMKELAMRVNNAASAYGSESTKSKFRRQKDAEEKFIIDFANKHLEEDEVEYKTVDQVMNGFKKHLNKLGTSKTQLIKSIFDPKSDFLHKIAKSKEDLNSTESFVVETSGGKVNLNMYEAQMLVYAAKLDFDPYSDGISQLVKYCKIDTKKQGKNITEQRDFKRGYRRLFVNSTSKLRKLFDDESLQALRNQSYIKTKTELALNMFADILSDQLLDATKAFNQQIERVLMELPVEDDNVSQQLAKKVSDAILIDIRSGYFNVYASRNGVNIQELVSGNNTIYDRLNRIKIAIQTDDRYSDLRNSDGSIDNYLLNMLTSGYTHVQQTLINESTPKAAPDTYPEAKFLSSMTFLSDDSVDADEVAEAWEELLEDSRFPELQQFARDLIIYSFITTGGNGGSNNIFKYIPASWLVNPDNAGYDASYAQYMEQKLANYQDMTAIGLNIDDVILNNWTDEQFIPSINLSDVQTFYAGRSGYTIVEGRQVNPNTDIPIILKTKSSSPSRFVKINRSYDPESQRSVAIYKRVKVSGEGSVYVLVDPKGQNFGGKNKIYEFGRSDAKEREVTKQLKLNSKLSTLAEALGADMSSIESVLNSLISFVDSKEDKKAAKDLLKSYGVTDVLYDIIEENILPEIPDEEQSYEAPTPTTATTAEEAERRGESVFQAPKTFVNRPIYKFGRVYLTENDKKFVKETAKFTLLGREISQKEIDDLQWLYDNKQILDDYKNAKDPKLQPNRYVEELISHFGKTSEIIYENMDDSGKVNAFLNKLAEIYHDHKDGFNLIKFIDEDVTDDVTAINNFLQEGGKNTNVKDMLYYIVEKLSEKEENQSNAVYYYSDSRQLELFSKKPYQKPISTIKDVSLNEELLSDLSDKQVRLGLNENNDQDPSAIIKDRPYDSKSQYSEFKYLTSIIKDYIKKHFGIKNNNFTEYLYSLIVKGINAKVAKLSIADTGGYVNDFQIKENKNGVVITPKHTDMLTKDKMKSLGEELQKQCEG